MPLMMFYTNDNTVYHHNTGTVVVLSFGRPSAIISGLCSCGLRLLLVVLKIEGQHRRNYNLSLEVEASLGLDMIDAFLWHAKTKRQRLANVIG